jgi:hypothetical protein
MEKVCDFTDEWRRRNNMLIFGIEEYPHETYFDTLITAEDVLKMKVKVEITNWHIERVQRLGMMRGYRPILVNFTSFLKKLDVLLQATRNLAGTRVTTVEDFSIKIRETCRQLIPYMIEAKKIKTMQHFFEKLN